MYQTNILPENIGINSIEQDNFLLKVSARERAILESLYLAPTRMGLMECYQIMESLHSLRPDVVQAMLESCTSIKVKRLFLCYAEKLRHPWLANLDVNKITLGTGPRLLEKGEAFDAKYQISIPREAVENYAAGSL